MICTAADAVGYEISLPCTKTMPAPAICTAADAVGYEIGLSWGESRRDMVFYAAASEVAHGKKKRIAERQRAFMSFRRENYFTIDQLHGTPSSSNVRTPSTTDAL